MNFTAVNKKTAALTHVVSGYGAHARRDTPGATRVAFFDPSYYSQTGEEFFTDPFAAAQAALEWVSGGKNE